MAGKNSIKNTTGSVFSNPLDLYAYRVKFKLYSYFKSKIMSTSLRASGLLTALFFSVILTGCGTNDHKTETDSTKIAALPDSTRHLPENALHGLVTPRS